MKQITLKDIAKELGIGVSTASRAIRDAYDINPETRRSVLELVKKYDYQPNAMALSFQSQITKTIGVIIPEIANPFFSNVISGIDDITNADGYKAIISQTHDNYEKEVLCVESLVESRVDGIIASLSGETENFDHFHKLVKKNIPLVLFDRVIDDLNVPKVIVDDFKGAYAATQHLIHEGYKKVMHIAGPSSLSISRNRVAGYKAALMDHSMPFDNNLLLYTDLTKDSIQEVLNHVINMQNKPRAIFTFNDHIALKCLKIFQNNGIKVPEDIAVIGFSNIDYPELLNPPLSTVVQPGFEMGRLSTEIILDMIEKEDEIYNVCYEPKVLETKLYMRSSSKLEQALQKAH